MFLNSDFFARFAQFFRNLFTNIKDGFLFIGGPLDIMVALLDIAVTSFILYYLLRLLRDSRAWQLLKGILLIFFLAISSSLLGLSSLGFVLNKTISVFAIAIVVIFQPELRRALETVGRSSFNVLSQVAEGEHQDGHGYQLIESIVKACEDMAETRTGALIVIERSTPLGDLKSQENAVTLDAVLSATALKQIFYLGSPLHDGAVVIRNGKIAAARVHIPLSDNYHLRRDLGTRHRAAIGASEMGDTIAIVCSEERGTISIAVDGRLYVLDNSDALRTQLHRLLLREKDGQRFSFFRRSGQAIGPTMQEKTPKRVHLTLVFASIFLSLILWFFVQVQVNPLQNKTFQVPLQYEGLVDMREKGFEIQYPMRNIQVTLKARKNVLDKLSIRDITAFVNLDKIDESGLNMLDVSIRTKSNLYTRVESLSPGEITVSVRPRDLEAEDQGD
ncbi:MAG: diadenylate cyclase CdaA [Eubacteriales bacterium]|nr:diadenylate cyclase CdaA [Eubacteriales bacterium]